MRADKLSSKKLNFGENKMKLLLTFAMAVSMAFMSACGGMATNTANTTVANTSKMAPANTTANTAPAPADGPMVGGAAMLKTKDIIDNASNSKDHTTLVAAVKAAGLVDTLKGCGAVYGFRADKRRF